uniref:Natterin-1 n=1 Tax=Bactrocera dorsalis TaxID=27457 RepID=A0A034VS42_BACDO
MQSSSNDELVPSGAFVGGRDCDGTPIYVGRSVHSEDHLPAKVIPSKGCAYVSWHGKEIKKREYEVLVGDGYEWVTSYGGSVPRNAVSGGITRHGERLYIGRVAYRNSLTIGKIHPSHGCLYIPFGGKELNFHSYEVLIAKTDYFVCGYFFKKVSKSCYVQVEEGRPWYESRPWYAPRSIELDLSVKIKF